MTKSTITRERLGKIKSWRETYGAGSNVILPAEEAEELARMMLAAMDSEPVGEFYEDGPLNWYQISDGDRVPDSRRIPLYRHAQQPVVPPMQHWEELCREHPDMSIGDAIIRAAWWNHCRAAMLQAGNSPVIPGAEQRISDAVDLLKKAAPAMLADNGGPDGPLAGRLKSPVTPEGWQVEAERLAEMHGMSFVLFRHGEAPQCADPTKVVISFTDKGLGHDTLPAAPQEVKGE